MIIRYLNIYGDMHDWSVQKKSIFTLLDFVNASKYPPSMIYMMMTIGPAFLFLSFAENTPGKLRQKIMVFGKVPFFYYILHVFLIHFLALVLFYATGHQWKDLDFIHFREGGFPYGKGYPLWLVYLVWVLVIIILYYPCKWYSRYKSTHKNWWLSYL